MKSASLHTAYAVVQRHVRLLDISTSALTLRATTSLAAIDCFALNQLLHAYPNAVTVIDCAAQMTAGASSALLLEHPNVEQVLVTSLEAGLPLEDSFQREVKQAVSAQNLATDKLHFFDAPLCEPRQWQLLMSDISPFSPVLILLGADSAQQNFSFALQFVLGLPGAPAIALLPVGGLQEGSPLRTLILECQAERYREILLFRELSPFLANSELALLYRGKDHYIQKLQDKLRRLFAGNFDFLNLLNDKLEADVKIRSLESKLRDAETRFHLKMQELANQTVAPIPLAPVEVRHEKPLPGLEAAGLFAQCRSAYQRIVPKKLRSILFNVRQNRKRV